jgi:4'-phosphopantetheinyl transferase EntD
VGTEASVATALIRRLFPAGVGVGVPGAGPHETQTTAATYPRFLAARRSEFEAGRAGAGAALADLGLEFQAIGRGSDGLPLWPAGYVGSISHCTGFCGAVAAPQSKFAGLGVDAEPAERLSPNTLRHVCAESELASFERLGLLPVGLWAKLAFCAKEAFYKAWFPLMRQPLGFRDVAISFHPMSASQGECFGQFHARSVRPDVSAFAQRLDGRWLITPQLALAGACAPTAT